MRLSTLELIRYGRFSGETLQFPQAACDFHLVVGANEAGKSTLRRAVSDLLFGMPLQSDMGFRHPLAELRLGARIASAAGTLDFHRARGRKSLRRPDDAVLPDTALAEHLGNTSAEQFKRMFCLDLAGLLKGGQSILDASDDMGQLLFQSAAGLAGLGAVRQALADEANKLYAPRRSGERAFYQALDQLDAAKKDLRGLTVNTRQWTAAMAQVEALQAAQDAAAARYRDLAATRQQWERIRRIAPRVAQLRDALARRAACAGTVAFPDDAGRRLDEAEVTIARQTTALALHRSTSAALQARRDALAPDDAILAQAPAVEALAAQGHAVAQHRQKIARAEQDLQNLLRDAASHAAQLRWPADEAALRARLPTALALQTLGTIMAERGGLLQAERAARTARARSQGALDRLQQQQAAPVQAAPPPSLAGALQEAQAFRTSGARQRTLASAQQKAAAQLDAALALLASWRMDTAALAALPLPSDEHLGALKAERAALVATVQAAGQQRAQAQEQARQSALALAQFTAARHVVTPDDVRAARAARDAQWQRIKDEHEPLRTGAPLLDQALATADRLVDAQRDHAEDAARLLGLRQDQERDAAAAASLAQQLQGAQRALELLDQRWTAQARAMGLPGMPLHDLAGWLAQRRVALDAAAALDGKTHDLQAERAAEAAATAALRAALGAGGASDAQREGLPELCLRAEQWLAAQHAAGTEAALLARQRADAQAALDQDTRTLQQCSEAVAAWQARWNDAVDAAALDADWMTPDTAGAAIALAQQVLALLAQADELRLHRIQALQQDLADVDAAAQALRTAPGLADDGAMAMDASEWVRGLVPRLQHARETQQTRARLAAEHRASEDQARAAELSVATTRASLQSLVVLAGSDDPAVLRAGIAASERRRALEAELQGHRQALVEQGDGLSLDTLLAQCDADAGLETLVPRLDALEAELADAVAEQNRLAAELARARAELAQAQGGTDAAEAESRRLEALAQLGDAAERYITVATGQRLLRWAIDRYRERKQGPLLQRAGALFAQLTLGGFSRLAPDFEANPPRLLAVRAGGERVGIEGLSEGTRDQLFLALRLAALELQIASDRPLPFIADDLFVNFHDGRSRAGLAALGALSRTTQVIFLTHHEHLVEVARECVGRDINVVTLEPAATASSAG